MLSVKVTPSTPVTSNDVASHVLKGSPGPSVLHKVGSAKQYATKSTGRVCNQAKFPTDKSPRKRG